MHDTYLADVDECSIYKERGTDLCIGICVNEPGSFSCSCPSGYTLGADKRICQGKSVKLDRLDGC